MDLGLLPCSLEISMVGDDPFSTVASSKKKGVKRGPVSLSLIYQWNSCPSNERDETTVRPEQPAR